MSGTLITGGAGFIGTNVADRLLRSGERVVLLDDLSRPGAEHNLAWTQATHGDRFAVEVGDVRDVERLRRHLGQIDRVVHLAAQVAVTTSVTDPMHDFGVNAAGTVGLLEELRRVPSPPQLLFTSTNKVYGGMEDVLVVRRGDRYEPDHPDVRSRGIGEDRPLHFCSPYGCSKGAADQYVLDYAATYGLDAVVFRMSCIYGQHQQGNEDQGWVAHFLKQAMAGLPITIYGDGRQVRDVLHVDDLVDAMLLAFDRMPTLRGRPFNIGGGPANTISLLELLDLVRDLEGEAPDVRFDGWRVGDQRWYVSDTTTFQTATGWVPRVDAASGVRRLHEWLRSSAVDAPAGAA